MLRIISRTRGGGYVLRFCFYMKEKGELIIREFFVAFIHPKRGNIVWTCVEDNIIYEKEEYRTIILCGFYYQLFQ